MAAKKVDSESMLHEINIILCLSMQRLLSFKITHIA
jgi:hypothetical protein